MARFKRDIYPELKKGLQRDEFLGRVGEVVVFLPLNEEEVSGK
jgi:ATP-dependent Clp protease ATP-binding subunit ClpB